MTLEHKILTLIDRGVGNIDDIRDILGGGVKSAVVFWATVTDGYTCRSESGHVSVTLEGLARLNELDE